MAAPDRNRRRDAQPPNHPNGDPDKLAQPTRDVPARRNPDGLQPFVIEATPATNGGTILHPYGIDDFNACTHWIWSSATIDVEEVR